MHYCWNCWKDIAPILRLRKRRLVWSTSRGGQDWPLNAENFQIPGVIIWKGKHIVNVWDKVKKVKIFCLLCGTYVCFFSPAFGLGIWKHSLFYFGYSHSDSIQKWFSEQFTSFLCPSQIKLICMECDSLSKCSGFNTSSLSLIEKYWQKG